MSSFHGKSGSVTFGSSLLNVTNWNLNVGVDTDETTSMGDTYKKRVAGFFDWDADVTCKADSGGMVPALSAIGTTATLVLLTGGGKKYTCTAGAMYLGPSHSQPADGSPDVTYKFIANGVAMVEGAE